MSGVGNSQNKVLFPIYERRAKGMNRYKTGYINSEAQLVIPPSFDDGVDFSEGLAAVRTKALWGFIDLTGQTVIKPRFIAFSRFRYGVAPVCTRKGFGLIDHLGNELVSPQYDMVGIPADGMIPFMPYEFQKERRYGYLNFSGEVVIPPSFKNAKRFSEGLAAVQVGRLWGYITVSGSFQIEPELEQIKSQRRANDFDCEPGYFVEGLAPVWCDGQYMFIDRNGTVKIRGDFENAWDFSEGRALVWRGGKAGFVSPEGTVVIEPQFSYAQSFSEGLAAVEVSEPQPLIGFIDREGNRLIKPQFTQAGRLQAGLCRVATEDWIGYINRRGELVWQGEYVDHGWY